MRTDQRRRREVLGRESVRPSRQRHVPNCGRNQYGGPACRRDWADEWRGADHRWRPDLADLVRPGQELLSSTDWTLMHTGN